MKPTIAARWKSIGLSFLVTLGFVIVTAASRPWFLGGPWPETSRKAVEPLAATSPDSALDRATFPDGAPFRFAVFGDQRALADGEWQELLEALAAMAQESPPIRFLVDTGDIVDNGSHGDQYAYLREILAHGPDLPYLPAVGNHEVDNGRSPTARANTARALAYLDPAIGPERLYYRRDIGALRFLFLDSNAFVYGDAGTADPAAGRGQQEAWLARELASPVVENAGANPATVPRQVIVVMHHPLVQSSRDHIEQASALWALRVNGRPLPELLLDGGVTLVLTGHTHTFERFRIERADGRGFSLVNLSGRPRSIIAGLGGKGRMARDIRGREMEWLSSNGWSDLEGWSIVQEDRMTGRGKDQVGLITAEPDGRLLLETCYLDDDAPGRLRRSTAVLLPAERVVTP